MGQATLIDNFSKSDEYFICYANLTEAHKANGLHYRNRSMSIDIKKELCIGK